LVALVDNIARFIWSIVYLIISKRNLKRLLKMIFTYSFAIAN
jgi:hypothetical protein